MMNNLKSDQVTLFICAELNNISAVKLSRATPSNVKLIRANNIRSSKKCFGQNLSKLVKVHHAWHVGVIVSGSPLIVYYKYALPSSE